MTNVLTRRTEVISSQHDHTDEERQLISRVRKDKEFCERGRKRYVDRWNEWYGLHRNYQRFRDVFTGSSEPDRDEVINEAKREFGAELFIPYIFTVIETQLPRLLMNNPRMKVKPKRRQLERDRAEAVRMMFEERQREIDYALKLIPVARRGLKYGLGVTKDFWDVKERSTLALESADLRARMLGPYVKPQVDRNEGPTIEDVELLDFFWDLAAKDAETCRWAIHRTWRDIDYIRERVARREWAPIDIDAVKRMAPDTSRSDIFREREAAAGLDNTEQQDGRGILHEVWEWHDGKQMVTILDGQLLVSVGENPFSHGQLPFSIFRPTLVENEFVGMGEIEPIVSLQHELNAIRSMRLDNAMLAMQKAFIYAEGLVDPADLIIGPGKGIAVQAGEIDQAIRPLNFGELPNAGYQEEAALKADIEFASAISETVAGRATTSETATAEQIAMSAANTRVELKTKMLTHELVASDTRQWLEMYRQHTLMKPREVAVEKPGGFEWITVSGQDLDLVEAVEPEEGSMAPEDTPQKRNDALAVFNQLRGHEAIDQRRLARNLIDAFDFPDPESYFLPEQEQLNPQVAEVAGHAIREAAVEMGMDEEQAEQLAQAAILRTMEETGVDAPIGQQQQNGAGPPVPAGQEA